MDEGVLAYERLESLTVVELLTESVEEFTTTGLVTEAVDVLVSVAALEDRVA